MIIEARVTKLSFVCDESTPSGWQNYSRHHPEGNLYHDPAWAKVIRSCFGHKTYFLTACQGPVLRGVLPLVHLKSRVFGRALVSMPYFNYGGLLADTDQIAEGLISLALALRQKLGADYIELRQARVLPGNWPSKSHKVNMHLSLPETPEALWQGLKSKLRSQIRKPEREGFSFYWGGRELLDEFYQVFSENMRDLGTPVYSPTFFHSILDAFPGQASIALVRLGNKPVAAGFLVAYQNKMEIPWASSLRRYNQLSPNMLLYWRILEQAVKQKLSRFDFGRSTRDSGTYKFKEQWGAVPMPSHWIYPGQDQKRLPEHGPKDRKYHWATRIWKKLPLLIANRCGPLIVKNIP